VKRLAVAFLCLALLAAPLGAGTQPPTKIFRIGVLSVAPPSALASASVPYARHLAAFRESLRDLGYVEGQNLVIEWRWAEGRYDRLPPGAEKSTTRTGEPEKSALLVVPQSPAVVTSRATWWVDGGMGA
jgi:hypothetical protein